MTAVGESEFYLASICLDLCQTFQLQEYQMDMGRCRFDTLGKLALAHSAGRRASHSLWTVGVPRTVGECVPHCSRSTHRAGHFLLSLGQWMALCDQDNGRRPPTAQGQ